VITRIVTVLPLTAPHSPFFLPLLFGVVSFNLVLLAVSHPGPVPMQSVKSCLYISHLHSWNVRPSFRRNVHKVTVQHLTRFFPQFLQSSNFVSSVLKRCCSLFCDGLMKQLRVEGICWNDRPSAEMRRMAVMSVTLCCVLPSRCRRHLAYERRHIYSLLSTSILVYTVNILKVNPHYVTTRRPFQMSVLN
jgi:hypothetical protein